MNTEYLVAKWKQACPSRIHNTNSVDKIERDVYKIKKGYRNVQGILNFELEISNACPSSIFTPDYNISYIISAEAFIGERVEHARIPVKIFRIRTLRILESFGPKEFNYTSDEKILHVGCHLPRDEIRTNEKSISVIINMDIGEEIENISYISGEWNQRSIFYMPVYDKDTKSTNKVKHEQTAAGGEKIILYHPQFITYNLPQEHTHWTNYFFKRQNTPLRLNQDPDQAQKKRSIMIKVPTALTEPDSDIFPDTRLREIRRAHYIKISIGYIVKSSCNMGQLRKSRNMDFEIPVRLV